MILLGDHRDGTPLSGTVCNEPTEQRLGREEPARHALLRHPQFVKFEETLHECVVHLAVRNPSKRDPGCVGSFFVPPKMMLRAPQDSLDRFGTFTRYEKECIREQHSRSRADERYS